MVEQVIKNFDIEYDLNLNLMRHNQTLSHITNEAIIGLEKDFQEFKPKLLIVQGDTSTAFAAALAASYNKIPIGLISGRITKQTFKKWRLFSNFAYKLFSKFDIC